MTIYSNRTHKSQQQFFNSARPSPTPATDELRRSPFVGERLIKSYQAEIEATHSQLERCMAKKEGIGLAYGEAYTQCHEQLKMASNRESLDLSLIVGLADKMQRLKQAAEAEEKAMQQEINLLKAKEEELQATYTEIVTMIEGCINEQGAAEALLNSPRINADESFRPVRRSSFQR